MKRSTTSRLRPTSGRKNSKPFSASATSSFRWREGRAPKTSPSRSIRPTIGSSATAVPSFIGFSDFTFLLCEIYYHARVPVVYFPSLKLGKGNASKILALLEGGEIAYQGRRWLTPPPPRRFSGIPIGGNLSTFVNFLNRQTPPKFSWRRHILFIEDIQVDVEDLHRLLAALRRHGVLDKIRGIVIGSLSAYSRNHNYAKNQKDALKFVVNYLRDVIRKRRRQGRPLPILAVSNFGHNITRDLIAVPIGGRATISKSKRISFKLRK